MIIYRDFDELIFLFKEDQDSRRGQHITGLPIWTLRIHHQLPEIVHRVLIDFMCKIATRNHVASHNGGHLCPTNIPKNIEFLHPIVFTITTYNNDLIPLVLEELPPEKKEPMIKLSSF